LAHLRHSHTLASAASTEIEAAPAPAEETIAPRESEQNNPVFLWGQVESADLAQYARNLRRVGFPDFAVKDALLPEVNRHYSRLLREQARFALSPKWANVPENVIQQHRRTWDELRSEQQKLLKSLFDIDRERSDFYQPWEFSVRQEEFPFLDDQLRERLNSAKHERSQARTELRQRGFVGPELDRALQPLIERQELELKEVLPPEVFQRLTANAQ
jgi:hypothetical protein